MPAIQGFHHVALTVSDLARSSAWYERTFGASKLAETELFDGHPIVLNAVGPVLIGLHRDNRVEDGDRFSEFRIGLDHLSLAVANRAEVEAWAKRLDELGVDHAEISDQPYGHVLVFRDPDNIQLEVMAQPDADRGPAPDDAPAVRGVSHVAITVSDLQRSFEWYRRIFPDALSVASMREEEFGIEYLMPVPGQVVGLQWSKATDEGDRFTEFRCGLDHLAFGCANRGEVEEWAGYLDGLGIEHSGVMDVPYGHVLVFRDPDNVQLELFATPG